jgi:hypothetical protein
MRDKLMLRGVRQHAEKEEELYVYPQCGLIFDGGEPDTSPVDETPGAKMIHVEYSAILHLRR